MRRCAVIEILPGRLRHGGRPSTGQPSTPGAFRSGVLVLMVLVTWLTGCGGESDGTSLLEDSSILVAEIPGLSAGRISDRQTGDRASVTKLYDVSGSWEAASVALADAVQAHGWTIESINCVGTGNDVIAKKQIEGTWVLLQSGAGTRGAGLILSIDRTPPAPFTVTGSCQAAFVVAAQS